MTQTPVHCRALSLLTVELNQSIYWCLSLNSIQGRNVTWSENAGGWSSQNVTQTDVFLITVSVYFVPLSGEDSVHDTISCCLVTYPHSNTHCCLVTLFLSNHLFLPFLILLPIATHPVALVPFCLATIYSSPLWLPFPIATHPIAYLPFSLATIYSTPCVYLFP